MGISEKLYKNSPILLQTLLLNLKATELYFERYGSKFWKLFEEFNKNQWLSETEIEEYQNQKLRALIQHAYKTVPYYNQMMKAEKLSPADIKSKDDLYKVPILTKEKIKNNFSELISTSTNKLLVRHGHTSGTTGTPLDLCYDIQTCVVHHVADWRQKYWAGLEYGKPYASIQGRVTVPIGQKTPPFWRKNYINNQLFLSSFHLTKENLPYYFEKLKKDNIEYLEGYPSTVYILAKYLKENNQTFPLKAILTSSETLFDFQRETIEVSFCCQIFDFYGMAERVMFATECDHHKGHHINQDYGIAEFLDSTNNPVRKGSLGRMVATSLFNFSMPLIRYQTNDSCSLKIEKCSCGRVFPLMDDVATKDEAIVTLPDGRLISPSILTHPFKPMQNILESQIIQEELNVIRIKIVINNNYTKKDEKQLIDAFIERLGHEIFIKIEYVKEIPRTKSGKFKWVTSKIEPNI